MEKHIRLALDLDESLVNALNQRANKEGLSLLEFIQALLRRFTSDENKSNSQPQALPNLIQNLYKTMPKKSTN
jgi:metal-responsive CopG/Arc/MetJ family transcriptional regulator